MSSNTQKKNEQECGKHTFKEGSGGAVINWAKNGWIKDMGQEFSQDEAGELLAQFTIPKLVGTISKDCVRPKGMSRKKKCMSRTEKWRCECDCEYVSKQFMGRNAKKRAQQIQRLHKRKCKLPNSKSWLGNEIMCAFQTGCSALGNQTNN